MNILLRVEHQYYGREDRYPIDPVIADTLRALTGTRTVTINQQNALLQLGHTFTEIDVWVAR